jgi:hypothetical protein
VECKLSKAFSTSSIEQLSEEASWLLLGARPHLAICCVSVPRTSSWNGVTLLGILQGETNVRLFKLRGRLLQMGMQD